MTPEPTEAIERLMAQLGYRFTRPELLLEALTHRSYVNESPDTAVRDNERFEFLGDAVLQLVVSNELMSKHPGAREGTLSKMRAAIVNESGLARVARAVNLGDALRLGRGEEMSGGRDRSSLLSDAFEALVAAVYLDGGLERVREVLLPRLELPESAVRPLGDPKTELQERIQATRRRTPTYRLVNEEGPDHSKTFSVEILLADEVMARGSGRTKKEAEQKAAATFLATLDEAERALLEAPAAEPLPSGAEPLSPATGPLSPAPEPLSPAAERRADPTGTPDEAPSDGPPAPDAAASDPRIG